MTPQAYPANAFAVKLNDRGVKARVKLPCNMSSNRLGEETKHLNVSSDKECRQLGVTASNYDRTSLSLSSYFDTPRSSERTRL